MEAAARKRDGVEGKLRSTSPARRKQQRQHSRTAANPSQQQSQQQPQQQQQKQQIPDFAAVPLQTARVATVRGRGGGGDVWRGRGGRGRGGQREGYQMGDGRFAHGRGEGGRSHSHHPRPSPELPIPPVRQRRYCPAPTEYGRESASGCAAWASGRQGRDLSGLRIVSYNVLAPSNIKSLFPFTPDWILDWETRRRTMILSELKAWDADVFCIQELENDEQFMRAVSEMGYDVQFKMRTGDHEDGCAIMYNRARFSCKFSVPLEFRVSEEMDRDNVALVAMLEDRTQTPRRKLLVATTHLLFNPKRGDIKFGQLLMLLDTLSAAKLGRSPDGILLCGDFNLHPQSPLYSFVSSGSIDMRNKPKQSLAGDGLNGHSPRYPQSPLRAEKQKIRVDSGKFWPDGIPLALCELNEQTGTAAHPLTWTSAYHSIKGREPEYTTFTKDGGRCVDYIFFDPTGLHLSGIWDVPDIAEVSRYRGGLPSKTWPSDHVALAAEFVWTAMRMGRETPEN